MHVNGNLIKFCFSLQDPFLIRELPFFTGRGASVCEGEPEFFEGQRGGTKIFSQLFLCLPKFPPPPRQRGGPEFFYVCIGGTRKNGNRPSQTDGPLAVKNDRSLRREDREKCINNILKIFLHYFYTTETLLLHSKT